MTSNSAALTASGFPRFIGMSVFREIHRSGPAAARSAVRCNLLASRSALPLLIRSQKSFAVEMDNVGRSLSNPYLSLPRDVGKVLRHGSTGEKSGHEDEPSLSRCEEGFQLVMPLESNRTMARDRFNQDQPVLLRQVYHHVGHLSVLVDFYAALLQIARLNLPM